MARVCPNCNGHWPEGFPRCSRCLGAGRIKEKEWMHLDHHPKENAPHVCLIGKRELNVHWMPGDGGYFKVSVRDSEWTMYLTKKFKTLDKAKHAAEDMNALLSWDLLS